MSCHCNVNNQHKVLIVLPSLQTLEKCSWMGSTFHHCFVTVRSACLVFLRRCPQSGWWYHYFYGAHYCTAPDSFCRLRHFEQPALVGGAWLLLIGLKADKWLCEKRYGLLQQKKKRMEIESWPLSTVSSVIFSILMSIMFMDYLAIFCSLTRLSACHNRPLGAAAHW